MLSGLFNVDPNKRFWKWFEDNADSLAALKSGADPILEELTHEIQKVHPKLSFEIGLGDHDLMEFIVSANGIQDVFPAVEQLVASAPTFADWKIIAFRQPKGVVPGIRYEGFLLKAEDVWFSSVHRMDKVNVTIYIHDLSMDNKEQAIGASFILLDCALGEYFVATRIGFIEHKPLPDDPFAHGLRPLSEIRKIIVNN